MSLFKNFSEDFENRILYSQFDDLSKDDLKQLEAEGITEAELQDIKATLLELEQMELEKLSPPADLRNKLLLAFDEKPQTNRRVISLPIWITTGISIAALFVIAFMLYNPSNEKSLTKQPVAQNIEIEKDEFSDRIINNTNPTHEEPSSNSKREENIVSAGQAESSANTSIPYPQVPAPAVYEEVIVLEDLRVQTKQTPTIINSENVNDELSSSPTSIAQAEAQDFSSGKSIKNKLSENVLNKSSMALNQLPNVFDNLITVY